VLAHEVSHIANGDNRVMGFADLVSRITGMLSLAGQLLLLVGLPLWLLTGVDMPWGPILVLLFAPTLSALVQLALSRSREYEADRSAAELAGDPRGLASALEKLERYQGGLWERLVMPGRKLPEPSLLRTHPPVEERVRRLMDLAAHEHLTPLVAEEPPRYAARGIPLAPRRHFSGLWY
jgi:heat shock protein HtpX